MTKSEVHARIAENGATRAQAFLDGALKSVQLLVTRSIRWPELSGAERAGALALVYRQHPGIVVAALARYNPLAVVVVAFLIGGLENAGNTLQGVNFPSGLVGVIQGIILFSALGGELLVRHRVRLVRGSKPAAAVAAEPAS